MALIHKYSNIESIVYSDESRLFAAKFNAFLSCG
jgi:hypothetical protein